MQVGPHEASAVAQQRGQVAAQARVEVRRQLGGGRTGERRVAAQLRLALRPLRDVRLVERCESQLPGGPVATQRLAEHAGALLRHAEHGAAPGVAVLVVDPGVVGVQVPPHMAEAPLEPARDAPAERAQSLLHAEDLPAQHPAPCPSEVVADDAHIALVVFRCRPPTAGGTCTVGAANTHSTWSEAVFSPSPDRSGVLRALFRNRSNRLLEQGPIKPSTVPF